MKRQITFWKNAGTKALRGRTVELFKVSWAGDPSTEGEIPGWVRDEDGRHWGVYKLGTQEVRRLTRDPMEMGKVTYVEEKEVDHLEAKDVGITPKVTTELTLPGTTNSGEEE